ncbi:hypothetical protein B0O99DRAFT_592098 [Bisporella sp. PMI_857]|nr:hypothetical protein B0O99DRAFT_592098 [Bisporella sp. PMI_857]
MAAVDQPTTSVPINSAQQKPHTHSSKLEDQAATAALYATGNSRQPKKSGHEYLDKNNKLSSAGAAASLKYANPQDLPSYPSAGLKNNSAAGTAANLGWANQKSFDHWKPDPSASASAAAMSAKDYKMAPLWKPEQSSSGAKAALLAHRDGGKVEMWTPEKGSPYGNSAATQAFKKYGAGTLSPQLDYGYTALGRQGSLIAATGAMSQGRKRANTTPIKIPAQESYPDESNAASNALSAATLAHRKSRGEVSPTGGASPYTSLPREMFTANPPVKPEVDEKTRKDTLHASAVAMAKGMYLQQKRQFELTTAAISHRGAATAHKRSSSTSAAGDEVEPVRLNNLQEAAQRLAQERLAKLHDEHAKNREYRDYYGNSSQPRSRISIRGRTRRRASSDGTLDEDREQSNKIRAQMSLFSNNINQIDEKKRKQDREALIAAAQRNVTKQMHGMDEKVFADTGKVAPSLLSEWELKAHAAAQAKSDSRMEHHGKVDIGGGKFVDQSAVDSIAQKNVQPVLDEINAKAEAERERQATIKEEQEANARLAALKKADEKETKENNKKLKQQQKDEEKQRKAEEKAVKKGEERIAKEKRKSLKADQKPTDPVAAAAIATGLETQKTTTEPEPVAPESETVAERRDHIVTPIRTSMEDQSSLRMKENVATANPFESTPLSPGKGARSGNVKDWLKSKFRGRKGEKTLLTEGKKDQGFVGGAAYTGASVNNGSAHSLGAYSSSMRDVALASAGKPKESEVAVSPPAGESVGRTSDVSSVSLLERRAEDEEFQEAKDQFEELAPPQPKFPAGKSHSPARDSKFREDV